jgi:hypothetical protein
MTRGYESELSSWQFRSSIFDPSLNAQVCGGFLRFHCTALVPAPPF